MSQEPATTTSNNITIGNMAQPFPLPLRGSILSAKLKSCLKYRAPTDQFLVGEDESSISASVLRVNQTNQTNRNGNSDVEIDSETATVASLESNISVDSDISQKHPASSCTSASTIKTITTAITEISSDEGSSLAEASEKRAGSPTPCEDSSGQVQKNENARTSSQTRTRRPFLGRAPRNAPTIRSEHDELDRGLRRSTNTHTAETKTRTKTTTTTTATNSSFISRIFKKTARRSAASNQRTQARTEIAPTSALWDEIYDGTQDADEDRSPFALDLPSGIAGDASELEYLRRTQQEECLEWRKRRLFATRGMPARYVMREVR